MDHHGWSPLQLVWLWRVEQEVGAFAEEGPQTRPVDRLDLIDGLAREHRLEHRGVAEQVVVGLGLPVARIEDPQLPSDLKPGAQRSE